MAGTADVLHSRLREGVAHSGRGGASFLAEAVNRARRAGATGPITIRADSAFYNHKILAACQQQGVCCSITAKLTKLVRHAITHIPDHLSVLGEQADDGVVDEIDEAELAGRCGGGHVADRYRDVGAAGQPSSSRLQRRRQAQAGLQRRVRTLLAGWCLAFPLWIAGPRRLLRLLQEDDRPSAGQLALVAHVLTDACGVRAALYRLGRLDAGRRPPASA